MRTRGQREKLNCLPNDRGVQPFGDATTQLVG
ncbi:hypothetical protein SNOG_11199 [Parastagonospora nodorum SN15]|uniref:Uncharacterized protein n=1 Tax=Phaeosphaeria nodorum (strain SN15 / ATCC MYA-4574 / FGSC 10173) TaxID=321614 RepID=Q0UAL5_PHANO|nr:hypothetical protein SNOG_11199 [Parastagonospora nodorum SN15]EAT81698.1 hypothetical protein SNOG_11199 [Parastagonospora nodorum SN15]